MLSFEFEFTEKHNKLYFARSMPYTYSGLLNFLNISSPYIKVKSLCNTVSGVSIPKVIITNFKVPKKLKKYVLVVGRMNPGETVSSYIIEGLVNFLLSEHLDAKRSRESLIYIIIPMLNLDGVIIGNSRCNISGISIHKKCPESFSVLCGEVKVIKQLAYKIHVRSGIFLFMEITGSFKNVGSFLHGPGTTKGSPACLLTKILSEFVHKVSPLSRLLPEKLDVRAQKSPIRIIIDREIRTNAFQSETSIYGYQNDKGKFVHNEQVLLRSHGFIIAESIHKCFLLSTNNIIDLKKIQTHISIREKADKTPEPLNSDSSLSDKSENEMDTSLLINAILKETINPINDFNPNSSSEEDDIEIKEKLIQSLQDYHNLSRTKQTNKKITIETIIPEAKDLSVVNKFSRNASTVDGYRNQLRKKIQRKEVSVSNINLNKLCIKKKHGISPVLRDNIFKSPLKVLHMHRKEKSQASILQSYEIPVIQAQPMHNASVKESKDKSKYFKFGPFPNLKAIHPINFFA